MQSDAIRSLGEIEDRHWWFAERRNIMRSEIQGLRPDGWAMDVGAAAGGNTRVLVDAGWDCMALEYSETGADLAAGRGLTVVRGDATRLPLADESLGLVVAYDVLEHIEDDQAEVERAAKHLAPGGHLIVLVPAHNWLFSPFDRAVGHFRRYNRSGLLKLGVPGLVPVAARYFDSVGMLASMANKARLVSGSG